MEKFIELLQEYLIKAIDLTEKMIHEDYKQTERIALMSENRERLMFIINQVASYITWEEVSDENKMHLNKQIDYIKKLDEELLVKLQEFKTEVQEEIKATHQQKENIKGYDLNDLK